MDHEYSVSGRLWVDNVDSVLLNQDCREYTLGDIVFLLSTTTAKEIQIILKDKSKAVSISDDKISTCCADLSRRFACRVRMESSTKNTAMPTCSTADRTTKWSAPTAWSVNTIMAGKLFLESNQCE